MEKQKQVVAYVRVTTQEKEEKNTDDDTIAKIQKLNELKDKGILT